MIINRGINPVLLLIFILISGKIYSQSSTLLFDIFTQENGLPNNQIQCVYQDKKGWIWVGTNQGLSRFDSYSFQNYIHNDADSNSISGNIIRIIIEDSKGNLLVGTENGGLNVFNRNLGTFYHPLSKYPNFKPGEFSVNDIIPDINGNIWIATNSNLIYLDSDFNILPLNIEQKTSGRSIEGNFIRKLHFDNKNNLWIGTNDGVYILNTVTSEIEYLTLPFQKNHNHEIWELYYDNGTMWIGTYTEGIFLADTETRNIEHLTLDPEIPRSETVRTVSKSSFGEYWIGTRGGFYICSANKKVINLARHSEKGLNSLSNNSVLNIMHDSNGDTWISTRNGLNLLARSRQVFQNFISLAGNDRYLNSSIVYAIWTDPEGNIWLGTEDGGINIYNRKTGVFNYLTAKESVSNSISQNCIKAFCPDEKGNLWVGTFMGGIDVINLQTMKIKNLKNIPNNPKSLSDNRVWDICRDKSGNMWIATSEGINRYDFEKKEFSRLDPFNNIGLISWIETDSRGNIWFGSTSEVIVYNPDNENIIRFKEKSRSMFEDSKKRIWIATMNNGFALYSKEKGPVKYFNEKNGLSNNQTLCILEDNNSNLWISTTYGLSKFNIDTEVFNNYTSKDGLGNNQFSYGAAYKSISGEFLFGTISGFNLFDPNKITNPFTNIPTVFTDLKIFNKSVAVSKNKKGVLLKSISETSEISLKHSQNVFTLEFAALSYANSENILYTYKLENFNEDWNEPGKSRSATYTNLNPGKYLLRIKPILPGGLENQKELQLNITITPPLYKTLWFRIFLFVIVVSLISVLIRFFITREKIKHELVLERINARKLHELDMMKLKFFTNVSHELRTPLTLILGPVEKILGSNLSKKEIDENLKLVQKNANNLNQLVNQLLDFRKLESGNLKLNPTESDLVEFIRNIADSFRQLANEKDITLNFNTLKKKLFVSFDPGKFEMILNNLLSNAFKFTGRGGSITINLSLIFDSENNDFQSNNNENQIIEIIVKDTGKGIERQNLHRIFDRFFQADDEPENSGTGIGLSLVKEFVKLHEGTISVTSQKGKGSKFIIRLPYKSTLEEKKKKKFQANQTDESFDPLKLNEDDGNLINTQIMLVVEDNADVRQFITNHFQATYKIYQAKNGEEGLKLALNTIPDIVISDIIMPGIDGYELCKRIKADEKTSHIPVLLLTAMHSKQHEIKGLSTGADDYITKPFDLNVLQAKVENILSIRKVLREKYTGTLLLEPQNILISSPDERFLQKTIEIIEQNMSDSNFDIELFVEKAGVSRMQLYRKLHALTNMSVKEFVRHIRLKRAIQMLEQQKLSISEIAYTVGFNDLSHFRKCFKQEFGMSASEYLQKYEFRKNLL